MMVMFGTLTRLREGKLPSLFIFILGVSGAPSLTDVGGKGNDKNQFTV